jgi:ChrR Cupin-like domain
MGMRQFVNATPREALQSMDGVDDPKDRFIKLVIGDVHIPEDVEFTPYQPGLRENVLIHLLFDNTVDDPAGSDAAIIKYLAGAYVPRHLHMGYEMVLVLQGEYVENDVLYQPGSLIIRAPGTTHEMRSETGCTILAMRDVPVKQLSV